MSSRRGMVGSFSSSLAFDDFAALEGVFLANHLGDGLFVLADVPLQLGESVEEGIITQWLVEVGDTVDAT